METLPDCSKRLKDDSDTPERFARVSLFHFLTRRSAFNLSARAFKENHRK